VLTVYICRRELKSDTDSSLFIINELTSMTAPDPANTGTEEEELVDYDGDDAQSESGVTDIAGRLNFRGSTRDPTEQPEDSTAGNQAAETETTPAPPSSINKPSDGMEVDEEHESEEARQKRKLKEAQQDIEWTRAQVRQAQAKKQEQERAKERKQTAASRCMWCYDKPHADDIVCPFKEFFDGHGGRVINGDYFRNNVNLFCRHESVERAWVRSELWDVSHARNRIRGEDETWALKEATDPIMVSTEQRWLHCWADPACAQWKTMVDDIYRAGYGIHKLDREVKIEEVRETRVFAGHSVSAATAQTWGETRLTCIAQPIPPGPRLSSRCRLRSRILARTRNVNTSTIHIVNRCVLGKSSQQFA
jgi:hypothetical protein